MTDLYAFGQDPRAFYSQSIGAVSSDTVSWTPLAQPMLVHQQLSSVATNGLNWVAVGAGVASSSLNPAQEWKSYAIWNQWVSMRRVVWHLNQFLAVGLAKNWNSLDEQACIFSTTNAIDQSVWIERYQLFNSYSGLNDIVSMGATGVLAVGYKNGLQQPLILFSPDGISWAPIDVDAQLPGAIFSVSYHAGSNRVWAGGRGWIATGVWNGALTQWTIAQNLSSEGNYRAISVLANNGSVAVAAGGSTVWLSTNSTDWQPLTQSGYNFLSAAYFQNRWWFGATSLLLKYTGFSFDPGNFKTGLQGFNSRVQASSLLVV